MSVSGSMSGPTRRASRRLVIACRMSCCDRLELFWGTVVGSGVMDVSMRRSDLEVHLLENSVSPPRRIFQKVQFIRREALILRNRVFLVKRVRDPIEKLRRPLAPLRVYRQSVGKALVGAEP
jgi:hypothetical protein